MKFHFCKFFQWWLDLCESKCPACKRQLAVLLLLFVGLICNSAYSANTPPVGNPGNLITNGGNGQYGADALGLGLVETTSGGVTYLNSTATGGVAPAGPLNAFQYNCSGSFCGASLGTNLSLSGSTLNAAGATPVGPTGAIQTNGGSSTLGSVTLAPSTILGELTTGTPIPIVVNNGLALVTTGGQTFLNATASGSIPAQAGNAFLYLSTNGSTLDFSNPANLVDPRTYGASCVGPGYSGGGGGQLTSGSQGLYLVNAGGSYTNGTYTAVPLTGGSGSGAQATIVVAGNVVTTVTVTAAGTGYKLRDQLSASTASLGGIGSGLLIQVAHFAGNSTPVYDGVHDDTAAFQKAFAAAQNTGQGVLVPNGCWVTTLNIPQGITMVGEGYNPNYGYGTNGGTATNPPVLYVEAHPAYAIHFDADPNDAFVGFEVNAFADGQAPNFTYCIGSDTSSGASSAYATLISMSAKGCLAGVGTGNGSTLFVHSWQGDYGANQWGMFGNLSDLLSNGDNFSSEGLGGIHFSGFAGEVRISNDRFEYSPIGVEIANFGSVFIDNSQFDHAFNTALLLDSSASGVFVSNSIFQASGVSGSLTCSPSTGHEAHITLSRTTSATPANLHLSNNLFTTENQCGPKYALEATTTGSFNDQVEITGGDSTSGYVTAFSNFLNNPIPHLQIDLNGQGTIGKNANGNFPAQSRGLANNNWSNLTVVGDVVANFSQQTPVTQAFPNIIGKNMGVGPTIYSNNTFSHPFDCSVVDQEIFLNIQNPRVQDNAAIVWLPSYGDPTYGAGFYQDHESDTNLCRLAGLVQMATPQKYRINAQAATTTGGTWGAFSSYGGALGLTSTAQNSTISFTTTTNGGPIYLGYELQATSTSTPSAGTFTYQLDSTTTSANISTGGSGSWDFPIISTSQTPAAVRIPVLTPGSHTLALNVTSTTSANNPVTILGIWTPPGIGYHGSTPTVFLGGQIGIPSGATTATAISAFNGDQLTQATQLFEDGLDVVFADVKKYTNDATDYVLSSGGAGPLNQAGHGHVAEAFSNAMQFHKDNSRSISPLDFGAACNTKYLSNFYGQTYGVNATTGSNVISIPGYVFQPGVATQNGGGDVGKVISVFAWTFNSGNPFKTTYIAAVTTSNNTATLGLAATATISAGSGNNGVIMGGYPSNPNDPSTAQDDTAAIAAASIAANNFTASNTSDNLAKNTGSAVVKLPTGCLVHDLVLASGTQLVGSSGGTNYSMTPGSPATTTMYIASTGYSDDVDTTTNLPRNIGINTANSYDVELKDFAIQFGGPSYNFLGGETAACVGARSAPVDTDNNPQHIVLERMSFNWCPVGYGSPYGFNQTVGLTATIAGTSMNVLSITTSNFGKAVNNGASDFLAVGRPVTGAGVTANTKIVAAPPGGGTGTYTLSLASTVTPSETMSSAGSSYYETFNVDNSQFTNNGIGMNGDSTDSSMTNTTFTSNFLVGWWSGPNTSGFGNGSQRVLGGRFEENGPTSSVNGAGFICDSCGTEFTGTEFQFNHGYALLTYGSSNYNVQVVGGVMEGNGAINVGGSTHQAQIGLNSSSNGGSNGNYMILSNILWSPVDADQGGQTSKYIFDMLGSGSNDNAIDLSGGNPNFGFATAVQNPAMVASPPSKYYKQYAPQLPVIDTSQSSFSVTTTGGVGIGTANATIGTALDLLSNTTTTNSSLGLPVGTTSTRPSTGVAGMLRYNSTIPGVEAYYSGSWNTISGSSSVIWPTTGDLVVSNSTNSPVGIPEVDGDCAVGSAGAWATGSCSGLASTSFSSFTSATTTNSLNNLNFAQTWLWSTATAQSPLSITATALTSGTALTITTTAGASGFKVVGGNTNLAGTTTVNNLTVTGTCTGCTSGSGVNSGTAGQVTWYATTGTTVSGSAFASLTTGSMTFNGSNAIGFPNNGLDTLSFAVGPGALASFATTSGNNVASGFNALTANINGTNNTAIGSAAGSTTTTDSDNTYLGYNALISPGDNQGVSIGSGASVTIPDGTAVGYHAVSGGDGYSVAIGAFAHANGETASIGYGAGQSLAGATDSVFVGTDAGASETSHSHNVLVGFAAGYGSGAAGAGVPGDGNTAVGTYVLSVANSSAADNVALGYSTGGSVTSGASNTILGSFVGSTTLTIGSNNILIGTSSAIDATTTSESNSIHIGGTGGDWVHASGTNTALTATTTMNGVLTLVTTGSGVGFTLANTSGVCTHAAGSSSETVSCSSDRALKKNITDAPSVLDWLNSFHVVQYDLIANGEHVYDGVIAQEVAENHKRMVHMGPNGYLTVDTPESWTLVKAVQELNSKIEAGQDGRSDTKAVQELQSEIETERVVFGLLFVAFGFVLWRRK